MEIADGMLIVGLVIVAVIGLLMNAVQSLLRYPEPTVIVIRNERERGGCGSILIVLMLVVIVLSFLASLS